MSLATVARFVLTGGQEADINQNFELIKDHDAKAVIADKGYDGDKFVFATCKPSRGTNQINDPTEC
jgi:hypothetical protein